VLPGAKGDWSRSAVTVRPDLAVATREVLLGDRDEPLAPLLTQLQHVWVAAVKFEDPDCARIVEQVELLVASDADPMPADVFRDVPETEPHVNFLRVFRQLESRELA